MSNYPSFVNKVNKKLFYNNPFFRLAAPLLFGILIYLLVLMFFDSVEMLSENFFSREVLFVIGLTFLFFELNRLLIVVLNTIFRSTEKLALRAIVQYLATLVLSTGSISMVLYLYFVNIEGFSTIGTELITFNSIYVAAALFYHLYYFSMVFLFRKNEDLVHSEQIKRDNLELELTTYQNQINPEFLFQTLEIIIEQLHQDKKGADELIDLLATVYRYTLDNQNSELVEVQQELQSLEPVQAIFSSRYPKMVSIKVQGRPAESNFLVPGTLQILFEHAIMNNLISGSLPLPFSISIKKDFVNVVHPRNERLRPAETVDSRLEQLLKTYQYLKPGEFVTEKPEGEMVYRIPLIEVEEE